MLEFTFQNQDTLLSLVPRDFDFVVLYNEKTIYIEVKTTTGTIHNCTDFPLVFEPKEWEWINNNDDTNALHYIVRVFDIEGSPEAYFLKQMLDME